MTSYSTQKSANDAVEVDLEDVSQDDLEAVLRAEVVNLSAQAGFDVESLADEDEAEAALALFKTILVECDSAVAVRDVSLAAADGPEIELRHTAPGETVQECWNVTMDLIGSCVGVYKAGSPPPVPKLIHGVIVDESGEELATWELYHAFVEKHLNGEWSAAQFERAVMKTSDTFAPLPSDADSSD